MAMRRVSRSGKEGHWFPSIDFQSASVLVEYPTMEWVVTFPWNTQAIAIHRMLIPFYSVIAT